MTTDPLQASTRVRVKNFAAVTLAAICIVVAVFALAAYATDFFGLRISTAKLSLSVILCIGGIALAGMALRGRGAWKEVAGLAIPTAVAAIVALRYGMPGIYLLVFVAYVLFSIYRWWRTRAASEF